MEVAKKDEKKKVIKVSSLKELAEKRVPKALKAISLVGNLATRKPTKEEAGKIVEALEKAVKTVSQRLYAEKIEGEKAFTL